MAFGPVSLSGLSVVIFYRARELAAVTPASFDLDAKTLAIDADDTKNRRAGPVQPLLSNLIPDLREFFKAKVADSSVWPGTWFRKAADMVRLDLRAARIPSAVQSTNGVEVRDFHAFRCTFISTVLASGADLKQAMTLARHTDPRLTTQTTRADGL